MAHTVLRIIKNLTTQKKIQHKYVMQETWYNIYALTKRSNNIFLLLKWNPKAYIFNNFGI